MTIKITPLTLAAVLAVALSVQGCQRREASPPPGAAQPAAEPATTTPSTAPATGSPGTTSTAPEANSGAMTSPSATAGAGMGGGQGMARGPGRMGGAGMAGMTLQQFQMRLRQRLMNRVDTNHDGRISLQEWTAWRNAHPRPNGGGVDPARQFQHLDLNHDGFITPDEIDAMAARRYQRRMSMGGAPMGRMAGPRAGAAAGADDEGPQ